MTVPFIFANQAGPIALSELDSNFAYFLPTINVANYGAVGDGVTDDTAAIASAIAAASALNGASVYFEPLTYLISSQLTVQNNNVFLIGAGGDTPHDGGTRTGAATTLLWGGSAGGTLVYFATPNVTTVSVLTGGGMIGFELNGNLLAANGLAITSWRLGTFTNIFVTGVTAQAFLLSCYTSVGYAEAMDTQRNIFTQCMWRLFSPGAAHGMVLTSANPFVQNANTSFNQFIYCGGETLNGDGFVLADCDNNTFIGCTNEQTGTGIGLSIQGGDSNYFWGFSSGGSGKIAVRGTASGYLHNPIANCFFSTDEGNGTQYPVIDANCRISWHGSTYGFQKNIIAQPVIAQSATSGAAQYANVGSYLMLLYDDNQAGFAMTNGTVTYSFSIDGSNHLRIIDASGLGTLDLTQGSQVSLKTAGVGFYGTTPVTTQPTAAGTSTGFTAGAGTAMNSQSTSTGGVGSTAYTFGDLVRIMKGNGSIAS